MRRFISFDCGTRQMACVVLDVFRLEVAREQAQGSVFVSDIECSQVALETADISSRDYVQQLRRLSEFVERCLTHLTPESQLLVESQFKPNTKMVQSALVMKLLQHVPSA